ncbi:MAG: flagellar biosynthetic protein FliO [Eubacterium sp.]|nr:flagellar biosynthetic protein FliO [Eubacterium sp.]
MIILGSGSNFLQFIIVLLIFIFVLALTYFVTKWLAGYQQGNVTNKNIRTIETYRITQNKFIQIVQIGKKYVAISVCKDTVAFITELDEEDILFLPSAEEGALYGGAVDFAEVFAKVKDKAKELKEKTGKTKDE